MPAWGIAFRFWGGVIAAAVVVQFSFSFRYLSFRFDRIYYCLLTAMAAVQAAVARDSFHFVDDLNGHHQERLGSTTTNRHGVAALDFATVSGCDQLVSQPAQRMNVEELLTS